MTDQPWRLAHGGFIDRSRILPFTFDGKPMVGHPGDTLASALLANGVRLVGRSFKYHRPRGIFSAGIEEPNALVELGSGNRLEPNTLATTTELFDGLEATSQNRWPNLRFDISQINGLVSRFLPAGFYYKTFMWPPKAWMRYEHLIRKAAGMGKATRLPDPDRYEGTSAHCEVLVIGGGPAGLAAALAAQKSGERVILLEQAPRFGGWLRREKRFIDGVPAMDWVAAAVTRLKAAPNVRVLTRISAFGYYDHNMITAVERVQDHLATPDPGLVRQRLWTIRAKRVVLATGAVEQPIVFPGNDRPGIMLAGAVRSYINQYGVLPGRRAVLLTNNDDAYRSAIDLLDVGAKVLAVLDVRHNVDGPLANRVRDRGVPILAGHGVVATKGYFAIRAVTARAFSGGAITRYDCDLLCISGGWAPQVHLHSQAGGEVVYNADKGCFVPGIARQNCVSIGAAAGQFALQDCLQDGAVGDDVPEQPIKPRWSLPNAPGRHIKRFVDFQDDVTAGDVALAHREGYVSVEHLKRYTTLGMGTDQGKTSNVAGLAIMADLKGQDIQAVGTTRFRPPYSAVALGVMAGRAVGQHFQPLRRSPMDDWHRDNGAQWIDAGLWRRPHFYPRPGEDVDAAGLRESRAVRSGVAMVDVTTLGKIDIQGPDASEFLNRVYTNSWKKLAVGKARYGVMLREDGMVHDDGTTSRLAQNHFVMTTTTLNAGPVLAKLEFYLQAIWPDLRVLVTSVTDQYAAIAVAGPKSRGVMQRLLDIDISNEAFPFMAVASCCFAGIADARVFRISFSGELAYEINLPADYGQAAWNALLETGRQDGIGVYGTEAMGTLRIEKGHVAGPEINGQTTAQDLGLGAMQSKLKPYIGKVLASREGLCDRSRPALVGLVPCDGKTWIKAGAQLVENPHAAAPVAMLGHVTSIAYSGVLDHPIALALLIGGRQREGDELYAAFALGNEAVKVRVVSPHFVDPDGGRMRV
jgi:sarcosine oxidase subunit alpha